MILTSDVLFWYLTLADGGGGYMLPISMDLADVLEIKQSLEEKSVEEV